MRIKESASDFILFASFLLIMGMIAACKRGDISSTEPPSDGPSGPGTFTVAPMSSSDFIWATPLGNLNPPGHTLPSDHVYFYWVDPDHRTPNDMAQMRPVYAPGDGTVFAIYGPASVGDDAKIMVRMTSTFSYYLDHVLLDNGITVGTVLHAGQHIGTSSPLSYAVDLGVVDDEVTRAGFVNPARYPYQTVHSGSPYKYFTPLLRDSLYARVRRNSADKDGKDDYDIAGKLVGGWFLKGLPPGDASANSDAWPKHLAFVYDMTNPGSIRISIGGTLSMRGLFGAMVTAQDPATVSPLNGKIGYKLTNPFDSVPTPFGLLIVQMLASDTIKVETFLNLKADTALFDSNASVYSR